MCTRTNTLNITLQPYAQSVRKQNISECQTQQKQQNICRICLETCPNIQHCQCRGSSMIHTKCLKLYIAKGNGTFKSKSKCEICGNVYNLVFEKRCQFSCKSMINYFKTSTLSSILFLIFSILTTIYISYCFHLNNQKLLNENQQLILLIVGICLVFVFLLVISRWIYIYLFVTIHLLVDIAPFRRPQHELTQYQLNQSQQYFK